jgi:tetratricopeptide (TPR) repeat protein
MPCAPQAKAFFFDTSAGTLLTMTVRSRVLGALLALSVPALVLVPLSAFGDAPPKKPAATPERYDPDNITAISQYMEMLVKGVERSQAKDHTTAIDTVKKAIQLNPKHALGHYLLGEVYLAANNVPEAEVAFLTARESSDHRNPALKSRVLFAVADVYERQKKWDDAKTAWQAYADHAAKLSPDAGAHPQSSAERLKVVQKLIDLEKAYAGVRERIAAEKDASADANKGAPRK